MLKENLSGILDPINNGNVQWTFNPFRLDIRPAIDHFKITIFFDDPITNAAFLQRARSIVQSAGDNNWLINSDGTGGRYYNGYIGCAKLSFNSPSHITLQSNLNDLIKKYPDANLSFKKVIIPLRENQRSFSGVPINVKREYIHILYEIPDTYLHDRTRSLSEITICFKCHRIKSSDEDHSKCTPACRHCLGPIAVDPIAIANPSTLPSSTSDSKVESAFTSHRSTVSPPSTVCTKRYCIKRGDTSIQCPRCPNPSIIHDAEDCPLLTISKRHVRVNPSPPQPPTSRLNSTSHLPSGSWASRVGSKSPPATPSSHVHSNPIAGYHSTQAAVIPTKTELVLSDQTINAIQSLVVATIKPILEEFKNVIFNEIRSLSAIVGRAKSKSRSPPHNRPTTSSSQRHRKRTHEQSDFTEDSELEHEHSSSQQHHPQQPQQHLQQQQSSHHPPMNVSPEGQYITSSKKSRHRSPPNPSNVLSPITSNSLSSSTQLQRSSPSRSTRPTSVSSFKTSPNVVFLQAGQLPVPHSIRDKNIVYRPHPNDVQYVDDNEDSTSN